MAGLSLLAAQIDPYASLQPGRSGGKIRRPFSADARASLRMGGDHKLEHARGMMRDIEKTKPQRARRSQRKSKGFDANPIPATYILRHARQRVVLLRFFVSFVVFPALRG